MRIALFSGNYNYLREGANQALNRLVHHLEAIEGHQVRVYSPVTRTPAFEPAGTLVPVPSVRFPVRGEFRLALGLPAVVRKDVRRFAPDLIHVATPDLLGVRAQAYARRAGVPQVASQHTLFETYLPYYRLGWLRPAVEAHLRRFYRNSAHVFTPTEALADAMRAMRSDDRVSIWSRGVDRSVFSPDRRSMDWRRSVGIEDDEVAILFFGRPVLEKGVAVYVDAMKALQDLGRPTRALVVGDGPASGALASIEGAVCTGHLDGEDLARAVASADLMLMPSTTEAFGNVVLEAMACGVPVVSADAPSSRSLIKHGRDGLLCPPLDVAAYVASVAELLDSPERRRAMGAQAARAATGYSWRCVCAEVEEAYRTVVHEAGIGRTSRR